MKILFFVFAQLSGYSTSKECYKVLTFWHIFFNMSDCDGKSSLTSLLGGMQPWNATSLSCPYLFLLYSLLYAIHGFLSE